MLAVLEPLEERFRAAAIELSRYPAEDNTYLPWGKAFLQSLRDNWSWFGDATVELSTKHNTRANLKRSMATDDDSTRKKARKGQGSDNRQQAGQKGNGNPLGQTQPSGKPQTCGVASNGVQFCKDIHGHRGCTAMSAQCPKGLFHGCDVKLANGKPCEGNHKRQDHRENVHGKWTNR